MKTKTKVFVISIITIIFLILVSLFSIWGIKYLFNSQYNDNGISHFLVITIDENIPKEYIGEIDGYKVYSEKLDLNSTYFTKVDATNISIKESLESKLVSIDEWRKYARIILLNEEKGEVLIFDNYEIVLSQDECLIRPLTH